MKVLKLTKKFNNAIYLSNFEIICEKTLRKRQTLTGAFANWVSGGYPTEFLVEY